MVRILFFMYDALPPFRPDVRTLFGKELPLLGISSDLVGQVSRDFKPEAVWGGGRLFPQGQQRKGFVGEFIRPLQDFVGLLRHLHPDHRVIQVRDKIRTGVLAWVIARLTGRKVVYWMSFPFADGYTQRAREVGQSKGWLIWVANWSRALLAREVFYRFLARRVDHLFVQSDEMLRMMERRAGVPAHRMTAVPMGVDAAWLARDRQLIGGARPEMLRGRRVLAYLGTLSRTRQPDFLIRVLEKVRITEPTAFLLLIGDAPNSDEQAWLRREIDASPAAAAIYLTGWLTPEDGQRWLAHADIGYSPIPRGPLLDVGSPTKAVEYLALGIPCIGNDNPDQRMVLNESEAGICVPMEVDAFTDASLQILCNLQLAAQMGKSGKAWVEANRTYSVLAPRVAEIYLSWVS